MSKISVVDFGKLSKPATVLVEKISDAIGGVFKPFQIVRVAQAEAQADLIRAESEIEITELHRRAMHRFLEEEAKKQSNIEAITQQSLPLLEENAAPEKVDDDWITNFFDKCRIMSDKDMQRMWAHVLAGEANTPGKFSRKTVNLIADLDKYDAELFTRLCGFVWVIQDFVPLIFNVDDSLYNEQLINFNSLSHLETLGLVQFNSLSTFERRRLPKSVEVFYFDRRATIVFPNDLENRLELGHVLLTKAGQELAQVCDCTPVKDYFETVYDRWASRSLVPARQDTAQAQPIVDPSPS